MEKANEEVIKAVNNSQNTQMHGSSFYCWHCCQTTLVHQDCFSGVNYLCYTEMCLLNRKEELKRSGLMLGKKSTETCSCHQQLATHNPEQTVSP